MRPWLLVVTLLAGCPQSPTGFDAGQSHDAGLSADAGGRDGGTTTSCPDHCPGHCARGRCLRSPATECAEAADCPDGRCSSVGRCVAADACLSHRDCGHEQRCASGRCVAKMGEEIPVQFERLRLEAVETHINRLVDGDGRSPAGGASDLGAGFALADVDGDLDLDLYIASFGAEIGGSAGCLLRNDSDPAIPRFQRGEFCDQPGPQPSAAFGTDLDNDGYHELLLTGFNRARLQRFHPAPAEIDLLDALPPNDPRRRCTPASAISYDHDADGKLDIMIGCAMGRDHPGSALSPEGASVDSGSLLNIVFLQRDDGFQALEPRGDEAGDEVLLSADNTTLALGAADLNDDGLLDLIVSEDSARLAIHNEGADPGGIYLRCQPDEPCEFRVKHLGPIDGGRDGTGYGLGAFMGSGVIEHDQHGQLIYISDHRANRMVALGEFPMNDYAVPSMVDFGFIGDVPLYAWGVVVDDFDRDGSDDLFVAHGAILVAGLQTPQYQMRVHLELLGLQRPNGRFDTHSADLGLTPPTSDDSAVDGRVYSARGAAKADLDLDGYLDLLVAGLEGKNKLYREVPNRRHRRGRCTVVPVDRYVPGFGLGHALRWPGDDRWRQWDSQGQLRIGTSPFVLSPRARGELRFPSGAVLPFDCGDGNLAVVEEPDWLGLSRDGNLLTVILGPGAPAGELTVLAAPSMTTQAAADGTVQLPPATERVMLRFGPRWTHRWWTL